MRWLAEQSSRRHRPDTWISVRSIGVEHVHDVAHGTPPAPFALAAFAAHDAHLLHELLHFLKLLDQRIDILDGGATPGRNSAATAAVTGR